MNQKFWTLVLLLSVFFTQAQTLKIVATSDGLPIVGVAVFNGDKSVSGTTNFDGEVDITAFDNGDLIFIQHISFENISITKQQILNQYNLIKLKMDASQLEEIVISASKFEQRQKEVPQSIFSISREEIALSNPQTAADLLSGSSAVYIQKSQLGGGSPMVRGFSTNRLLLTVDGVRMNTAIFRSGNVQSVISIDPFFVERTEVVLGPGSTLYGSDAIGGVMNFYTLKPKFSVVESDVLSGNALIRYATASNEKTGHVDVNYGRKQWAFTISFSYTDFDDLRMGSHGPDSYLRNEYVQTDGINDQVVENDDPRVQKFTGYSQYNLLQKISFKPNGNWVHNLNVIYTETSDYPRYDRLIRRRNGELRSAEWFYGPQTWLMAHYNVIQKSTSSLFNNAIYSIAYQQFKEGRNDRNLNSDTMSESDEKVTAISLGADFEKRINDTNKLYYGLEYLHNRVSSSAFDRNVNTGQLSNAPSRYPNGSTWQSIAAYMSYKWNINDNATFQSGFRYNHILVDSRFNDQFFNFPFTEAKIDKGAFTGNAGISWQLPADWQIKANLSTAFRAPNVDDIGKIFDSEPGSVVVPNPDLKHEYAYNGEIAFAKAVSDNFQFDIAFFYTKLNDALVRRDFSLNGQDMIVYDGELSQVQAVQNAGEARSYGFEVGVRWDVTQSWNLNGQLSYVNGDQEEDDGSTSALRHAAPLNGNAHLVWKKKEWLIDLYGMFNGQIAFENLAITERNKEYLYAIDSNGNPYAPRWYTLNVRASYDLSNQWNVTAALENITDQRYRTYSSGIAAAGRNFITSLKYRF